MSMNMNNKEDTEHRNSIPTQSNSHSEIEKHRRDKLKLQITELARILPISPSRSQKLDKLSVLKMTVQYMKEIQGVASSYTESCLKHPLISDQELNNLIVQIADGFVFAVSCHRGEIIYLSKSVMKILGYSPEELVKNNLFDYVHPKDVPKLKEQLFCSDDWCKISSTKETYKKCIGARRSFFCRIKRKEQLNDKNDADSSTGSKNKKTDALYNVIQCIGYLKPWRCVHKHDNLFEKNLNSKYESDNVKEILPTSENDVLCLVAVGRLVNTSSFTSNSPDTAKPIRFDFKFTVDGKFLIVDQDITFLAGFLPQELLGNSMFEYFHPDDIPRLIAVHKATLQEFNSKNTDIYRFRTKDNTYIHLRSEWKCFQNPWTKVIEFITAKNYLIRPTFNQSTIKREYFPHGWESHSNIFEEHQIFGCPNLQSNVESVETLENQIKLHLDASKIGEYIANTYLDKTMDVSETISTPSFTQNDFTEEAFNEDDFQSPKSTMAVFNDTCTSYSRDVYTRSINCATSSNSATQDLINLPSTASIYGQSAEGVLSDVISSPSQPLSCSDTNDEVDMALLMNMLEAEAGLGGSVNHCELPWPLP